MSQEKDHLGFFESLQNTSPYFKCAAQGLAGSGKTFTLAQIAIGLHQRIGSTKPIVIIDTEKSAKFLKPYFRRAGIEVLTKESRTLPDVTKAMQLCHEGLADILMIDSITHIYEQFLEDYKQKKGRTYLQFQDWGFLKPTWKREFSDALVNARVHILFTGREGFTYDYEDVNGTGKKELVKTGVKMKAEGETAYEPDLLIRMERFEQLIDSSKPKEIWREATIVKDRSTLLDGRTIKNPTFEDFLPIIDFLLDDVHEPVDTLSHPNSDLIGDEEERRSDLNERKAMLERNNAELDKVAAGTVSDAKKLRVALIEHAYYGETSTTAVASMSLDQLTEANSRLRERVKIIKRIVEVEPYVYPVAKAVTAAREKYLKNEEGVPTTNLGEVPNDQLLEYGKHIKAKYRDQQAKDEAAA